MARTDLNLEELEWSDDEEFDVDEETLVRSTVETLQAGQVDSVDVEATKVIPTAEINEQINAESSSDIQELLDIIDAQEGDTQIMPDLSSVAADVPEVEEDFSATKVSPAVTVAAAVEYEDEIALTEAEVEELGDLEYHDEEPEVMPKAKTVPKTHPGQARNSSANKSAGNKAAVKTGDGRNIKVQKKKKNAFQQFILNLQLMDAVIALVGVLAAVVLVFVFVFWNGNNNKVKDLGEFTSIGMQLSELDTIGRNGINRIVSTSGGDVVGEAFIPSDSGGEEEAIMVSVSFTSIERDLKIKFSDKVNEKLIEGYAFELEAVTPSNETLTWVDEDKDGVIYQEGLAPGAYMVTIKSVEDFSFPSDATKVMVKDKISYQVINVLDEIKTEDEINVAVEDTESKENVDEETRLADTVKWVPSEKKVSSGADGYAPIDKATITDPQTLVGAALGGFRKVNSVTMKVGEEKTITLSNWTESESATYTYTWESKDTSKVSITSTNGSSATIKAIAEGEGAVVTCKITIVPGDGSTAEPQEQTFTVNVEAAASPETPAQAYVTGVTLDKATAEVTMGSTATLVATVNGDAGCDTAVTWTSSNEAVLKVANGVITPVAAGEATVTATTVGKDASGNQLIATCKVTVKEVIVPELILKLKASTAEVKVGQKYTIESTVENATDAKKITYAVDKKEIATVDDKGVVTGVAKGTAVVTVTVTDNGKTATATCTITVQPAGDLAIKLKAEKADVLVGEKYTIESTIENATDAKKVTYAVDKKEIATVDDKGVVTGVAKGTAVVTVTVTDKGADGKDKTVNAKITITVKANPKKDTTTLLKDASGKQVYVKDASGNYVQAKWADYYTATAFYIQAEPTYTYYGWQTLNGKTYFFDETGKKVTGEQVISGVKYNFASDGSLSMNGGVLGIDVSKWNGTIDWNAVKNSGISFVIIRCGYRGSATGVLVEDPKFESYIKGATKAGLKVGLYFFSQAISEKEAVEEASMAISLAKDYKISYPIYIDTEWTSGGRANSLSKETRTAVCKAFCETIKSAGYTPGVYACKSWYQDSLNVSTLNGYKIWLAQYASQPTYSNRYDMWQYTDKGKVNGITTNVDMNISYSGY